MSVPDKEPVAFDEPSSRSHWTGVATICLIGLAAVLLLAFVVVPKLMASPTGSGEANIAAPAGLARHAPGIGAIVGDAGERGAICLEHPRIVINGQGTYLAGPGRALPFDHGADNIEAYAPTVRKLAGGRMTYSWAVTRGMPVVASYAIRSPLGGCVLERFNAVNGYILKRAMTFYSFTVRTYQLVWWSLDVINPGPTRPTPTQPDSQLA
jgi:hypothetical protein